MLGVRRTTVTITASLPQSAGVKNGQAMNQTAPVSARAAGTLCLP
jgi:hypothetical protein